MLTRNCVKQAIAYSNFLIHNTQLSKRIGTHNCLKCLRNKSFSALPHKINAQIKTLTTGDVATLPHSVASTSSTSTSPFVTTKNLLEKYMTVLSANIHQKNRVYKNDLMRVLKKIKEINISSKKQGLHLLRCCTELLPDETPATRMALAEDIWKTIAPHTTFEVEHYNELLNVYIANGRTIKVSEFLTQMLPIKPTITTYELMLRVLGEAGDLNQSTEVISNMKAQGIPATVHIFNSLILCQGKRNNMQSIQEILTMMKSLNMEPTMDTATAKARAFAWNKQNDWLMLELENAVQTGLCFNESQIMEIVKTLAVVKHYDFIPKVLKYLPRETLSSPSISPLMQSVATLLVFQNHPLAALDLYNCLPLPSFGPKDDKGLHARAFIRDCVKANIPSVQIIAITDNLMASGRNPIALHNACEAALQFGKIPLVLDLFDRMKALNMPVRPHYFWPVLLHSSKCYGEKGIMNTLKVMVSADVKPDYETITNYVLPFVRFTSPQTLMKKFLEQGLSVSTVLTPMMETLLNSGQVRAACELCELFKGKIDTEKLVKPLVNGYIISAAIMPTVQIMQDVQLKASNKDIDFTGRVLCELLQHKKIRKDVSDFVAILKELKKRDLHISLSVTDFCTSLLPQYCEEGLCNSLREMLSTMTDERITDVGDVIAPVMPHPRSMNEENLRAHLNELEAKGMNTRGVLRKLLQLYCRDCNLAAAKEIVQKCENEGVFLSAGMKASILDLHVKCGELEKAKELLVELKKCAPNFSLDEFKVLDFAKLMVERNELDRAFDLIADESKMRRVMGGRSIEKNCLRLLETIALKYNYNDTVNMFNLLNSYGYCQPNNVILGPLIRTHLHQGDLSGAVEEFTRIGRQYKKTPLKHELLCKIMIERRNQLADAQNQMLEDLSVIERTMDGLIGSVLSTVREVHGNTDAQLSLMASFAEVGDVANMRKMLQDPNVKIHPDALLRRCQRFADEKKTAVLWSILECAKINPNINVDALNEMILNIFQRDDDVEGALSLWQTVQDNDGIAPKKLLEGIASILNNNNRKVPESLLSILNLHSQNQEVNEANSKG